MNLTGLHVVLGSDAVELLLDESHLLGVCHIALIDGNANHKVILIGLFQPRISGFTLGSHELCLCAGSTHSNKQQRQDDLCNPFHVGLLFVSE